MSRPQRETSVWVDIDLIVPHPRNPNHVSAEMMTKLEANLDEDRSFPLLVRDLAQSKEFYQLFQEGKYQLLDGEHRLSIFKQRGVREVEVRIWHDVSDEKAWRYLLTLNHLRGADDKKRRAELIKDLSAFDDAEALATILPESAEDITKMLTETTLDATNDAKIVADKVSQSVPVTVFCDPQQADVVRGAIDEWLAENDPERLIQECREGTALAAIIGLTNYGSAVPISSSEGDGGDDDDEASV